MQDVSVMTLFQVQEKTFQGRTADFYVNLKDRKKEIIFTN